MPELKRFFFVLMSSLSVKTLLKGTIFFATFPYWKVVKVIPVILIREWRTDFEMTIYVIPGSFRRKCARMGGFSSLSVERHFPIRWSSGPRMTTNGRKSHSGVTPVTSPNLTSGCTIFLQTLWPGLGGLQEWHRNDIGMTLEWHRDDRMAREWLGWLGMT